MFQSGGYECLLFRGYKNMIDPKSYKALSDEIVERIKDDKTILDQLRQEISP
jgi:hypothetical protein